MRSFVIMSVQQAVNDGARPLVTRGVRHRCVRAEVETGPDAPQQQLGALGQTERVTFRNRNTTITPLIAFLFLLCKRSGTPVCMSSLKALTQCCCLHTTWSSCVILKGADVCLLLKASAGDSNTLHTCRYRLDTPHKARSSC